MYCTSMDRHVRCQYTASLPCVLAGTVVILVWVGDLSAAAWDVDRCTSSLFASFRLCSSSFLLAAAHAAICLSFSFSDSVCDTRSASVVFSCESVVAVSRQYDVPVDFDMGVSGLMLLVGGLCISEDMCDSTRLRRRAVVLVLSTMS